MGMGRTEGSRRGRMRRRMGMRRKEGEEKEEEEEEAMRYDMYAVQRLMCWSYPRCWNVMCLCWKCKFGKPKPQCRMKIFSV